MKCPTTILYLPLPLGTNINFRFLFATEDNDFGTEKNNYAHELWVYKKHPYKKRLVEFSKNKKRTLVRFGALRNEFLY